MIEKVQLLEVTEQGGERFALVRMEMTVGHIYTSIPAEQLIQAGRACENHEQGKAHDSGLDLAAEADNILASIGGRK